LATQASRNGHKELVRCLCLAGCRIDVKNKEGVTPDMTALAQGHGDISELLKRLKRVSKFMYSFLIFPICTGTCLRLFANGDV
jgi:ankyrin repeat protein